MNKVLRTAVATASGVALTFTVTMAAEVPANAATSCNTTFSSYHTVKAGTRGTQAKAAQCLLHAAGYSVRADGSFSSADSSQLKRFQRTHSVPASGVVYQSSWTALLSRGSTPTLRYGQRNASVKRLQKSLTATGRYVPATGYYGTITRNAVKSVQRARHLSANGVTNRTVWRILQGGDPIVSGAKAPVRKAPVKKAPAKKPSSSSGTKGARALAFAKRQIGDRYSYASVGPDAWDCSGLTYGAWKSVGIKLPRNSAAQSHVGKRVSKSALKPGDLVFFYSPIHHVAIYAGGGKVIHAPRPGKRVEYIKMSYMPFNTARRPG